MRCPKCGGPTGVLDTRMSGEETRRRRECQSAMCGHRYTTLEIVIPEVFTRKAGNLLLSERIAMVIGDATADAVRALFSGANGVAGRAVVVRDDGEIEHIKPWAKKLLDPKLYRR